jgi:hypothetical protein
MDEDGAREFTATARWRYAWTYRKWAEHWYTRREDASDREAWTQFARFVWEHSRPLHWKGGSTMICRYWDDVDSGFMYWCGSGDENVLVNRARILDPDPRTPA